VPTDGFSHDRGGALRERLIADQFGGRAPGSCLALPLEVVPQVTRLRGAIADLEEAI